MKILSIIYWDGSKQQYRLILRALQFFSCCKTLNNSRDKKEWSQGEKNKLIDVLREKKACLSLQPL